MITVADQASGLRRMMQRPPLRVIPITGSRLDLEVSFAAANLSAAYAAQGNETALIDGTHGEIARALGLAARFELMHLIEGFREFDSVALDVAQRLRAIPAARGLEALARDTRASGSEFFGALARLPRAAEIAVFNIGDPATAALLPGGMGEILLPVGPARESLEAACLNVRRLYARHGLRSFRVLLLRTEMAAAPERMEVVRAEIARHARVTVLEAGTIPRDPALDDAMRARRPVNVLDPQSPAAAAYRRVAAALPKWTTFDVTPEFQAPEHTFTH